MKRYIFPSITLILVTLGIIAFILVNKAKETEEANNRFCNMNVRPESERQKAIEAIRIYANDPKLDVVYACNNFSPTNPSVQPTEETYEAEGKFYFVDVATNQIIREQ